MQAALVTAYGKPPVYTTVPHIPPPGATEIRLRVIASGLHNLVRSRASGQHYSSPSLPCIPGTDGIGIDESSGSRYFFSSFRAGGTFAEYINVERDATALVPDELETLKAAALVNPAISSWMAIKARTVNLPEHFSVLILGATSASGRLAISLARALGASKVFGAARSPAALSDLNHLLDGAIVVADPDPLATNWSATVGQEIDLVLDYINGPLANAFLSSHEQRSPMQYLHIGTLSGKDMVLPGALLRSKNLTIRGSGPGAWRLQEAIREIPGLMRALAQIGSGQNITSVALSDVERAWDIEEVGDSRGRIVFVP